MDAQAGSKILESLSVLHERQHEYRDPLEAATNFGIMLLRPANIRMRPIVRQVGVAENGAVLDRLAGDCADLAGIQRDDGVPVCLGASRTDPSRWTFRRRRRAGS